MPRYSVDVQNRFVEDSPDPRQNSATLVFVDRPIALTFPAAGNPGPVGQHALSLTVWLNNALSPALLAQRIDELMS